VPSSDEQARAGGRRRPPWRRIVLIALAAAVFAAILIIGRHTLMESVSALGHLDWVWFVAAIAFEAVSLTAFGLSRRRLLRVEGHPATFGSVMAVTYAGNALSMSLPFAGTQLAAVFTYKQFRRHGVGSAVTGWALAVSAILSTSALALVLVVGALAGGASAATAAGFAVAAVFVVPALAVLLALRYQRVRRVLVQIIARLVRVSQRLFHRPEFDPHGVEDFLDRVVSIKLAWPRYAEVFALAVINWVADCGCLACAILATGSQVPWRGLVLAYGAGAAVGSTGVTPGGFGIVEVTLTAALTAVGLGASRALTAVLTYRLINFWLILIGGWITVIVLTHRQGPGAATSGADGAAGAVEGTWASTSDDARGEAGARPEDDGAPRAGDDDDQLTQAGKMNQTDLID
jgi:putative heme transporter